MNHKRLLISVLGLILALNAGPALAGRAIHAGGALSDLQTLSSNPTDGAWGLVTATRAGGRTVVVLNLKDLDVAAAGATLGAHVHVGACVEGSGATAGPHFNITGQPPTLVSPETEVWLDFQITDGGTGHALAIVPFEVPDGAANSIVIHAMPTLPNGTAGARLACIGVGF
jgi:Cu/Zn superoxide dismutase